MDKPLLKFLIFSKKKGYINYPRSDKCLQGTSSFWQNSHKLLLENVRPFNHNELLRTRREPCEPRYFMRNDIYQISGISVLWQCISFRYLQQYIYIINLKHDRYCCRTKIETFLQKNTVLLTNTKYSNNSVSAQFPHNFCTKLRNSQTNLRENPSHEGYQS